MSVYYMKRCTIQADGAAVNNHHWAVIWAPAAVRIMIHHFMAITDVY